MDSYPPEQVGVCVCATQGADANCSPQRAVDTRNMAANENMGTCASCFGSTINIRGAMYIWGVELSTPVNDMLMAPLVFTKDTVWRYSLNCL